MWDNLHLQLMMACTVGDFTVILTSRQPSNSPELEIKNRILQGNDGYHMMSWVLIFVLFVYMALSYALGVHHVQGHSELVEAAVH